MSNYYEREPATHIDGSPMRQSPEDQKAEDEVASILEKRYNCQIRSFGMLAPIDRYAMRNGRLIGVLEVKCRQNAHNAYPTVFLSVRKWLGLILGSVGLGVPGVYVVRFTDKLCWIPATEVDATKCRITGARRLHPSENDIEPLILVPISELREVTEQKTEKANVKTSGD